MNYIYYLVNLNIIIKDNKRNNQKYYNKLNQLYHYTSFPIILSVSWKVLRKLEILSII